MRPSLYCDRVVDLMEKLVKFTLLTRRESGYLTDRYSERKEDAEKLAARVRLRLSDVVRGSGSRAVSKAGVTGGVWSGLNTITA